MERHSFRTVSGDLRQNFHAWNAVYPVAELHLSASLYKAPNKTDLDLGKNISKRTRFVSDWVFRTL